MGYDAGIITVDEELKELVAKYYDEQGADFDAKWARNHGGLYDVRGWSFADMTSRLSIASTGFSDDEDNEYFIVPVEAIGNFTDAYRAFAETDAGRRILACEELDCDWAIGNADSEPDDYDGVVYISPEKMVEAKHAADEYGAWELFDRLLEERWRITQLEGMAEIVDVLRENGIDEVGWYESY